MAVEIGLVTVALTVRLARVGLGRTRDVLVAKLAVAKRWRTRVVQANWTETRAREKARRVRANGEGEGERGCG